jgi:predicted PhzF superfamily epimerase YddE/YHI9
VTDLHVVRVFTAPDGSHGNPLGVFLDGRAVAPELRQGVAADLGFSETVFVDDVRSAELRIFTPQAELPLAGHPLVGTAWLLWEQGHDASVLRPPAGNVPSWREGDETWVRAHPDWGPAWDLIEIAEPAALDALKGAPEDSGHAMAWCWEDRDAGLVRARVFGPDYGVPEDEATGSAAMRLCARLGRPLTIRQGRGSVIGARPAERAGFVEFGGGTELEETRVYEPAG